MSTSKSKPPKAFLARIKERVRLNPGSEKETYHIVLDLEGSGIEYSVGDCIGVYPENDPTYVKTILEHVGDSSLQDYLLKGANLNRIPKKILGDHPDLLTSLKYQKLDPHHLQKQLLPLLPRFYSIASSANQVKDEVHLTVALSKNPPECPTPYGVCSDYLCRRAPLMESVVPIFLQPSRHFSLPADSKDSPIIMIGPGTGVAPFRGFMQEREHAKNWLFFGERNEKTDFYYRSFWEQLAAKNLLEIECAFSRDQEEKIYVQHRMLQNSQKLWKWIEEGAYIFVCGDASRMAKDVDRALQKIIEVEGRISPQDASAFLKDLRKLKRYQRDVY